MGYRCFQEFVIVTCKFKDANFEVGIGRLIVVVALGDASKIHTMSKRSRAGHLHLGR